MKFKRKRICRRVRTSVAQTEPIELSYFTRDPDDSTSVHTPTEHKSWPRKTNDSTYSTITWIQYEATNNHLTTQTRQSKRHSIPLRPIISFRSNELCRWWIRDFWGGRRVQSLPRTGRRRVSTHKRPPLPKSRPFPAWIRLANLFCLVWHEECLTL